MSAKHTSCKHENFRAAVDVNRLTETDFGPVVGFNADITIACLDCGEPFCFRGLPLGVSQLGPTASFDGTILCVPIHPMSDPIAGIGLPGVSARFTDRSEDEHT